MKDKKGTPCKYFRGSLQSKVTGRFRSPSQTWNVGMEIDAITGTDFLMKKEEDLWFPDWRNMTI